MQVRLTVVRMLPVLATVIALVATCLGQPALGQYRADPVDRNAAKHRPAALDSLTNPSVYATAKDGPIVEYFNNNFFPTFTQFEPEVLDKKATDRELLIKKFLFGTNNAEYQKQLTDLTFAAMARIVVSAPGNPPQPPYHPAVRYNAVLILGQLDDQYPSEAGGAAATEKPNARANAALTAVVDSATTTGKFPSYLVMGALIGLERHAQLKQGLPPDAVEKMSAAAMKLVTHDEPVLGVKPEVYAMMRLRAAGVLAQLGSLGKNNEVYNALLQLTNKLPLIEDRCEAAGVVATLIGKNKAEGLKVDSAMTADQLLKLASAVAEAEFAMAIEFEQKVNSDGAVIGRGGGGRPRPGGGGRSPGREVSSFSGEAKEMYPRRTLVANLLGLRQGLAAAKPLVGEDVQAKFTQVLAAVDPLIQQASDKETIELGIADLVRNLRNVVLRVAPPAAAATPKTAAAQAPLDAK